MRTSIFANMKAVLVCACMAVPVYADEERQSLSAVVPEGEMDWREVMDLQSWSTSSFHADLKRVIETLTTAHGEEQIGVFLNAAELYLTHMLLFEASSVLDGLTPEHAEHRQRHAALGHAALLLQGQPVQGFEVSPLNSGSRPDASFWRSLQAIATADAPLLGAEIDQGFVGLGMQSRAVLRSILPVFTEAAVESERRAHVDAALRMLAEFPDLSDAPVGHFLFGRSQERRGNQSSALEAYFTAAEGWDQYAVRARLAVADMSLENGSRGALLAAQSVLVEGAEAWRGDQYELELLKRLVRVYEATENEVGALLTLGKMLARFPKKQEAEFAKESARRLLGIVYEKGRGGAYPLADWMDIHLQLLPFFRQEQAFAAQTEVFADYLLELGATDLASQEFRRALRLVRDSGGINDSDVNQDVFRLSLKLAGTQLQAGLAEDARITLELMEKPSGTKSVEEYAALSARVLAELGDRPALLKIRMQSPSAQYLRQLGQALAQEDRWAQSSDVFQKLWDKFPQQFTVDDAARLLIAANRSGDIDTRSRIVRSFPSLTRSKPLIELAESLQAARTELLPLRSEMAAERLRELEDAFESIRNTAAYP